MLVKLEPRTLTRIPACLATPSSRMRNTRTSPGLAVLTSSSLTRCRQAAASSVSDPVALPPVRRVGRHGFWLRAVQLAPDAPDRPQAIRAPALNAGLVVIGRAEPAARRGNDLFACDHVA